MTPDVNTSVTSRSAPPTKTRIAAWNIRRGIAVDGQKLQTSLALNSGPCAQGHLDCLGTLLCWAQRFAGRYRQTLLGDILSGLQFIAAANTCVGFQAGTGMGSQRRLRPMRIANDVRFGLAAAVWTKDIGRAIRMSEKLQAGTV